jgi:chorismate synthase
MTLFGESHGKVVGTIVEGCPAGLPLGQEDIQRELDRRKPGHQLASGRRETDRVSLFDGTFNGKTTGGPLVVVIGNEDVDSSWYLKNQYVPRPGHSDYTAFEKYHGFNDFRGGGFFSGRMTAGMVMAGAVGKKLLSLHGIRITAHMLQIGCVEVEGKKNSQDPARLAEFASQSPVSCADLEKSGLMVAEIERAISAGDSLGGKIECVVTGLPVGVGEPLFDSTESVIAHAMLSIPAVKAIEFGSGFSLCGMKGSEANDAFQVEDGRITTKPNNSGGVLGGITNGMPLVFRVAVKPTPSIGMPQKSVDLRTREDAELRIEGRHDPCIAVRAVPVVEAMAAVCIADLMIIAQKIPRTLGD